MTDKKSGSGLGAVDEGPISSDASSADHGGDEADASEHASVAALKQRFADAVVRHRVYAGGQHVVWIDPGRAKCRPDPTRS